MKKEPKCKICGGPHYQSFCFRAPKKVSKRTKPIKVTSLKAKSSKTKTRAELIKQADQIFSLYIRRKDAIGGIARCVTCGTVGNYKTMQNGHYVSRRKLSVRWDELNCHVQCKYCNENLGGNLDRYKQYLVRKYGHDVLFYLQDKSKHPAKITRSDIQTIINRYKEKVLSLERA